MTAASSSEGLCKLFGKEVSSEQRDQFAAVADLEAKLRAVMGEAQKNWPNIVLSAADYFPFLGQCAVQSKEPLEQFLSRHGGELYLTSALARQDAAAIAVFEEKYRGVIGSTLARFQVSEAQKKDLMQIIRKELFVGEAESPPKISKFSGKGDLGSWLKVTLFHLAFNAQRSYKNNETSEEDLLQNLVDPDADPALRHIKKTYRDEFRVAFRAAMQSLSARERNLLRHRLLDGMRFEELARVYHVHQATLFRWMNDIREKLLEETRNHFSHSARIQTEEFSSVFRLIRSQLDISLSHVLKDE